MARRTIVVWADGVPVKVAIEDGEPSSSPGDPVSAPPSRERHAFAVAVQQATALTPLTEEVRHRVEARSRMCADCGSPADVIHRLRTDPVPEERELVILCETCHRARHAAVAGPVLEAARDAADRGLSEGAVHVPNEVKKRAPWPPRSPDDEERIERVPASAVLKGREIKS